MSDRFAPSGAATRAASKSGRFLPVIQPTARRVISRAMPRCKDLVASLKGGFFIPSDSGFEADYFRILETDNAVRTYRVQPEELTFTLDGKERSHFPDVMVDYVDGSREAVELKWSTKREEFKPVEDIARDLYAARCIPYLVLSEGDVRVQPRLTNAKEMLKYRRYKPSERLRIAVADYLSAVPVCTLGQLLAALPPATDLRRFVLGLALRGGFDIDLNYRRIDDDSLVSAAKTHSNQR